MRPPYTSDYVCTLHGRPGDHPEEQACGAFLFQPAAAAAAADATTRPAGNTISPALPTKKYRRRPEPAEVEATPFGALFMISNGQGPEYPMPRDQFLALYEEVEADELPEDAGALASAPGNSMGDAERASHVDAPEDEP